MKKNKIKEILLNLLYSFISFALPTAILQFIIQPLLAKELGAEVNGQYLTIMSAHYFFIGITASVLNHVRLLQQKKYEEKRFLGDFNIILLIYAAIAVIIVPFIWMMCSKSLNFADILLMIFISWLYLYHDYIFVEYRLKLQYNKILIDNILMSFGYMVGFVLFMIYHKWQLIFISAYVIPDIYDFLNTSFIKEPIHKTEMFSETAKKVAVLTCSTALGSATSYCDKFILFPILGGVSVSIYYSASVIGKMLLLVSSPLNSVLLSYLVKIQKFDKKAILKWIPFLVIIIVILYVGCILCGYPLTMYLYPDWAEKASVYIPFTVATSVFNLIGNFVNTVLIRFYKLTYQVSIQIISLILYLVLGIAGLYLWGLFGFCAAIACASFGKLLILSGILISCSNKQNF